MTLAALLPLPACGTLSRAAVADQAAYDAELDDDALARLRGAEPLVPATWGASLERAGDPQTASVTLGRALEFMPDFPPLLVGRVQLLGELGRHEEQVAAARDALATQQRTPTRGALRWLLVDGLLARSDPDAARVEALAMGAAGDSTPADLAQVYARIALAYEVLGRPADADEALDQSLDLGPMGTVRLGQELERQPAHRAAVTELVTRARARHEDHPDLILLSVGTDLAAGRFESAEQQLAQISDPYPRRLRVQIGLLQARLDVQAGRYDDAWDLLRRRLDAVPADPGALLILLECQGRGGVPSDDELRARLLRARPRLTVVPSLARMVDAVLEQLGPATPPPTAP